MDYESLELELQDKVEAFKHKWKAKLTDEYNGNSKKMYRENRAEIQEDMEPIWEICMSMGLAKGIESFVTVEDLDKALECEC